MEKPAILVIGLDGATFDLMGPLMEKGKLPHLKSLIESGSSAKLRSTVPHHSGPAWASFATGMGPGKHGIYSFFARDYSSYTYPPINSRFRQGRPFWNLLNDAGKSAGIVNVPGTFPPDSVDGFMITGMLSPDLKSACYPEELHEEILDEAPGYSVEAIPLLDKVEYVRNIRRSIEARTDLGLYLLRRYSTDVFVVVFTELDRLQHFFWSDMDSSHPMHSESLPEIEQAIEAGYMALDTAVGRLLEAVGEETITLILSDHGFEGVFKIFYVNSWLEEHGYLRIKNRQTGSLLVSIKRGLQRLGLWKAVRRLGSKVVRAPDLRSGNLSYSMSVDWKQTKAAFGPNLGININLQGREPQGIVSENEDYESLCTRLREELESCRDPETGEPVVERVLRREEVYTGDMVAYAPDLRLIMAKSRHYPGQYAYSPKIGSLQVLDYPDKIYGNHAEYGIFIISGYGIRSGLGLHEAEIVDIAPTILQIMGLAIPKNMDGRPLSEVFDETGIDKFCSEKQVVDYASADAFAGQTPQEVSTDQQETQVTERLRDLGYLD